MKSLAFFVEGATEVFFVKRLIREIAQTKSIHIQTGKIIGGKRVPVLHTLNGIGPTNTIDYYFQIMNCKGDKQVAKRILDSRTSLQQQKFEKVIGLRDAKPEFLKNEIPRANTSINRIFQNPGIPVEVVISTMEIESIFLAEISHFGRIDSNLTVAEIYLTLGFSPLQDDMELRDDPATDLNDCYSIVNKTYDKTTGHTIQSLDFNNIYQNLPNKFGSLNQIVSSIESFLM